MRALVLALAFAAAGCLAKIDDALIDNGDAPPAHGAADAGNGAPPGASSGGPPASAPPPEQGDDSGAGAIDPGSDGGTAPDGAEAGGIDHLVGHWTFEEGTGTYSADLTSGNHQAHLIGATWTQGYESGGVKLAGTGFIDVPGIPFPTPGTLSVWFALGSEPPASGSSLLDNPATTRNHIYIDQLDTNLFQLQSFPAIGSVATFSLPASGWHHFVLVWTTDSIHVFVDDTPMGSVANKAGWDASEQDLRLFINMFVTLDDVRLYDVALQPTQVP
jgi:hypothetical protein